MARIISVANQKGGVGKTTTAVNLSASLALNSKSRVLLIDMDPQSNASSAVGVSLEEGRPGVYEFLVGEASFEEVMYSTEIKELQVVPASPDLAGAEIELVVQDNREKKLLGALNGQRHRYDFIVIDCPPSLGLLTLNAFTVSKSVLIPMQCEYFALQGLSHLLKTLKRVKNSLNPNLVVEGILLTMYDGRTLLTNQVREEIDRYFKDYLLETVIPRNVRLSEAPSHGRPVALYDDRCRGAESYSELAQEILGRIYHN
tara:strand:- start:5434 stop:6207 length:774 start_codon:yes stop_codon:yes gene_type:complete